jgi:mRNA interferase RelE/StbE
MSYNLVYTHKAAKDIHNIEPSVRKRIGKALLRYKEDPIKYSRKMINSEHVSYRFRIGDYRVIFDIENDDIVVLRIGHRREIYRR